MASKTSLLGIFVAILAEKWPYRAYNARFGHFYTQGMAILVEGRQEEEGIPGVRQVQTAGYWVWAVGSVSGEA